MYIMMCIFNLFWYYWWFLFNFLQFWLFIRHANLCNVNIQIYFSSDFDHFCSSLFSLLPLQGSLYEVITLKVCFFSMYWHAAWVRYVCLRTLCLLWSYFFRKPVSECRSNSNINPSMYHMILHDCFNVIFYFIISYNNSEVLLGANIHRPDAPLASQEREESEN